MYKFLTKFEKKTENSQVGSPCGPRCCPGDAFSKQGFVRKGSENVVGPMPPFGELFKTDTEIWKIIAWIRSVNP